MGNTAQPTHVITISPSKAAAMLKVHSTLVEQDPLMKNRNIKEEKVRIYARDMAAGKWELNGETVILAVNGRVLDGQHRLLACVQSGVSFRTHVVENVAHSAMKTIDTGVTRTLGDQLTIFDKANGNRLAVALGVLFRWEETERKGFAWTARPSRQECFTILDQHPGIQDFVTKANRLERICSPGLAAALWYIFAKQDAVLADAFFDALATGTNMQEADPVFLLRERLIKERRDLALKRIKANLSMNITTELIYRAWDATRRDVKISKLQRSFVKNAHTDLLTRRTKQRS